MVTTKKRKPLKAMDLSIKEICSEFKIKTNVLRVALYKNLLSHKVIGGMYIFDKEVFAKEWDAYRAGIKKKGSEKGIVKISYKEGFLRLSEMARFLGLSPQTLRALLVRSGIELNTGGYGLIDKKHLPFLQRYVEAKKALKEAIKNKPE